METIKTVRHETTLTKKEVFIYGLQTAYETYGKEEVEVPSGFEAINEFRPPIVGEYFIGKGKVNLPVYTSKPFGEPRFILKKKEEIKPRSFILKYLGKKQVEPNQYFETHRGGALGFERWEQTYTSNSKYEVYERIEL